MIEGNRSKSTSSSRYTTVRRAGLSPADGMGGSFGDLEDANEGSRRMREIYGPSRFVERRSKGRMVLLVATPFILIFGIHAAMSWYVLCTSAP